MLASLANKVWTVGGPLSSKTGGLLMCGGTAGGSLKWVRRRARSWSWSWSSRILQKLKQSGDFQRGSSTGLAILPCQAIPSGQNQLNFIVQPQLRDEPCDHSVGKFQHADFNAPALCRLVSNLRRGQRCFCDPSQVPACDMNDSS